MKNKKRIITEKEQRVAADILTEFAFGEMSGLLAHQEVWQKIFDKYRLFKDPFTNLPESARQHAKSGYAYDKQTFEDKYDVPYEDFYGRCK